MENEKNKTPQSCNIDSVIKRDNILKGQVYKHHNTYNGAYRAGVRTVKGSVVHHSEIIDGEMVNLVNVWEIGLFLRMFKIEEDLYLNSV
jgi:hypothetical protein